MASTSNIVHAAAIAARPADLLKLNDSTLLAILKCLRSHDLNAVALTCRRLQTIARNAFQLKASDKRLNIAQLLLQYGSHFFDYTRQYLHNFGAFIDEIVLMLETDFDTPTPLYVNYENHKNRIFDLVGNYCGGTLKTLRLNGYDLAQQQITAAELLFRHVTTLELKECSNISRILKLLVECRELDIKDCAYTNHCELQLPNLHRYSIGVRIRPDSSDIEQFLLRHHHLRDVEMYGLTNFNLRTVAQMKQIESFAIHGSTVVFNDEMDIDWQMPQLKKLKLHDTNNQLANAAFYNFFLTICSVNTRYLEQLDLSFRFMRNEYIDKIAQCIKLRSLKFRIALDWFFDASPFKNLKNLNDLNELELDCTNLFAINFLENLGPIEFLGKLVIHSAKGQIDGKMGSTNTLRSLIISNVDRGCDASFIINDLQRFPNLYSLEINCENLTDDLVRMLQLKCWQIEELSLVCAGFTWNIVQTFIEKFERLRILRMGDCWKTDIPTLDIRNYDKLIKKCRRHRPHRKFIIELKHIDMIINPDRVNIRENIDSLEFREIE